MVQVLQRLQQLIPSRSCSQDRSRSRSRVHGRSIHRSSKGQPWPQPPLAVVNSVAVAVGGVAIAVGPVATVQQVGISSGLGLSLSLPLAVVKSMAVAVGPV